MLKIVLGCENAEKYLTPDEYKKYRGSCKYSFKSLKERSWFRSDFAKRVIEEIDGAKVIADFAVESIEYNTGYSVDDLSGGAKTLITMYNCRKYIFSATMGENCIDFLEEIAADYEKEGEDLIIVSNWLMDFNFKYIDKVYFINWNKTCYNQEQIDDDIFPLWYEEEKEGVEYDDTPTKDQIEAMNRILKSIGVTVDESK